MLDPAAPEEAELPALSAPLWPRTIEKNIFFSPQTFGNLEINAFSRAELWPPCMDGS